MNFTYSKTKCYNCKLKKNWTCQYWLVQVTVRTINHLIYLVDGMSTTHQREASHAAIKRGAWDDIGVPGTPLHVKAPLVAGRDLVHDLSSRCCTVGVPAQDTIVFSTAQQQVCVLGAPGHAEDTSEEKKCSTSTQSVKHFFFKSISQNS